MIQWSLDENFWLRRVAINYQNSTSEKVVNVYSIYPAGYHVDSDKPLSFINLASQKNNISLYHSGIYVFPEVLEWFKEEYSKHIKTKLDMGKSCIRFRNMKTIPCDLLGEL